ncbi:uncharacterized protein LOC123267079 [Cotesia glomerata]|uniref:uncharacterized protein LOC123267079 n=1 Tax=Cotesia glomerata TaxID=32391 RepID=UPI001D02D653|nr:uncharacterized protein LOC123267079 [Cotesia glomerata]
MQQKLFRKRGNTSNYNFNLLCKRIIFYGLLSVFKLLGLSPWKVNLYKILTENQDNNQVDLFKASKYGSFYNILLATVLSTYCAMVLSLKLYSQTYVKSELVDKIDECLMFYGTLVLVVIWLSYVLQQKKMIIIINGLYSINNNLKSCDRFTFKSDCRFYILSVINFCLCFGIIVTECSVSGLYTAILWIGPFFTSSWVLMQYTLLLNVISQFFESINLKILQLADINTENYYQTALRSKVSLRDLAIKDINCISNAIMQLCDICDQVADFYAIPILLIIVYFITSTTFNSYFIILSLIITTDNDLLKLSLDFGNWFLIVSFEMISLASNVTRITREFKKTPQYVSLLLNRCAMNSPTKESLLDFLRDLSYRNVNFNAYGVIALNGSLLQTIYGTIVTYLIILIQFRNQQ